MSKIAITFSTGISEHVLDLRRKENKLTFKKIRTLFWEGISVWAFFGIIFILMVALA